jgi:NAD(P)-dependent dehydrogenase (short-subunit alcohol dehydrogenase family)
MNLTDRVAIVTGSANGIGRGTALRLAQAGATVCVNDRKDADRGEEVVRTIKDAGGDAFFHFADVTIEDEVNGLVCAVLSRRHKIDILVNNCGVSGAGKTFCTITGDDWDRMLTANTKGTFLTTQAVMPHMIEAHYGKIVNIASTAGTGSIVTANAHYAASKGAIVSFTRRMARDFASHGITVNSVAPGFIHDTGFNENASDEKVAHYTAQIPMGRPGYVKDCCGIIAFLCSEEADFITGQIIVVDGGATC